MKKFVIVTDSCSDLSYELRKQYNIEDLQMHIIYDGKDIPASLDWEHISVKDFYDLMRGGTRVTTSQVNGEEYIDFFENRVKEGYDILSISCSSALSSSYKGSLVAREEILKKYPDAKIICVDALNACSGLGLIAITAAKLRDEGKTIEEVAEYIEANKLKVHQLCTADDLVYLKRAGRVSATSAFFGGILKIKPIIISDANGQNVAVEKVKGRKPSLKRLIEKFKEEYRENPYQAIIICHADCPEDAEYLKSKVEEAIPNKSVEIITSIIGPTIGATVGPGTVAIYCYGEEVTYKA